MAGRSAVPPTFLGSAGEKLSPRIVLGPTPCKQMALMVPPVPAFLCRIPGSVVEHSKGEAYIARLLLESAEQDRNLHRPQTSTFDGVAEGSSWSHSRFSFPPLHSYPCFSIASTPLPISDLPHATIFLNDKCTCHTPLPLSSERSHKYALCAQARQKKPFA